MARSVTSNQFFFSFCNINTAFSKYDNLETLARMISKSFFDTFTHCNPIDFPIKNDTLTQDGTLHLLTGHVLHLHLCLWRSVLL